MPGRDTEARPDGSTSRRPMNDGPPPDAPSARRWRTLDRLGAMALDRRRAHVWRRQATARTDIALDGTVMNGSPERRGYGASGPTWVRTRNSPVMSRGL